MHICVKTAESYVLSQPHDGERSIIMASGSTSNINAEVMSELWKRVINKGTAAPAAAGSGTTTSFPRIVTTEVSQVPLSGVIKLLKLGAEVGALTLLDVDVSPSVCVNEARLGSMEELIECVKLAKVTYHLICGVQYFDSISTMTNITFFFLVLLLLLLLLLLLILRC
jgi:hypothetical protein